MIRHFVFSVLLCGACLAQHRASSAGPHPARTANSSYEISGTVTDAISGEPLSRVRVTLAAAALPQAPARIRFGPGFQQPQDTASVFTADDGRFLFSGLSAGKYQLIAQRLGYLREGLNQHDQFSSAVVVGPSADSHNIAFHLHPQAAIRGKVLDEANEPVRNATVMLFRTGATGGQAGPPMQSQAVTNDEGSYRFARLSPGKYILAVAASPWYAPAGNISMGMLGGLRGITTFVDFQVTTTIQNTIQSATGSTQALNPALDLAYPISFYPGTIDPNAAGIVELSTGDNFSADFLLQPVQSVHVVLPASDDGNGLSLTENVLGEFKLRVPHRTTQVNNGPVELAGIPPGHYTLGSAGRNRGGGSSEDREVDIIAGTGEMQDVTPPRAPVTITIQAEGSEGAPSRSFLQLRSTPGGRSFAQQIEEGDDEADFDGGVPPGTYEVSLGGVQGVFIKSISATGATLTGRILQITGTTPVKLAISLTVEVGRIEGAALRGDKPVTGAMVLLVPEDPDHNPTLIRRAESNTDGSFSLTGVLPGKYTLLALENGWELEWTRAAALNSFMAKGQSVEVTGRGALNFKVQVQ